MADDDVQDAINKMDSRLGRMEGQLNVVTRALAPEIMTEVEKSVRATPTLGQVYLALDGKRTHQEIADYLSEHGVSTTRSTVWKRIQVLEEEFGIAVFERSEPSVIHNQSPTAETTLNASARIRKLLDEMDELAPPPTRRRRRR